MSSRNVAGPQAFGRLNELIYYDVSLFYLVFSMRAKQGAGDSAKDSEQGSRPQEERMRPSSVEHSRANVEMALSRRQI